MDFDIRFEYNGKTYSVPKGSDFATRIVLPDGRVLITNEWSESLPAEPVIEGEMVIPDFVKNDQQSRVEYTGGVPATEVK